MEQGLEFLSRTEVFMTGDHLTLDVAGNAEAAAEDLIRVEGFELFFVLPELLTVYFQTPADFSEQGLV